MSKFIFNYRNLNNYYKFILYSSIFLVIFIASFGLSIFSKEIYLKNIFHSKEDEPIGYRQSFIRQIFCFLITLFLSCIFCKFEKKEQENLIHYQMKLIRHLLVKGLFQK